MRYLLSILALVALVCSSSGQYLSRGVANSIYQSKTDANPSSAALGSAFGQARQTTPIYDSLPLGYGGRLFGYISKPKVAVCNQWVLYVSSSSANGLTTGNDSTGTGTKAAPYLTIEAALAAAPSAGGGTILVNDGSYSPNVSGRLILSRVFTDWVSIEPYTGRLGDVTITSSNSVSVIQIRSAAASHYQFRNLKLSGASLSSGAIFQHNPTSSSYASSSVRFFGCQFDLPKLSSGGANYISQFSSDTAFDDFAIVDSFATTSGSGTVLPSVLVSAPATTSASNQPYTNVVFWGLKISSAQSYGGWSQSSVGGIKGLTIANCDLTMTSNYGVLVGADSSDPTSVCGCSNVVISGGKYTALNTSSGHPICLGVNVTDPLVEWVDISGGLHGVILKACTRPIVRASYIDVANGFDAIYYKASTNAYVLGNTAHLGSYGGNPGWVVREGPDPTTGYKSSGSVLVGNWLIADDTSEGLYNISDSTGSTGGARMDYNVSEIRGAAFAGTVRGATISTVASLRSAWSSAGLSGDLTTNDAHTAFVSTERRDISFSGTASTTYYVRLVHQNGLMWNGYGLEPRDPDQPWRCRWRLVPTTSGGTTYTMPVPYNLMAGYYTVVVYKQAGSTPAWGDPEVGRVALAYAS